MTTEVARGRRSDALANHTRILTAGRSVLAEHGLDMEMNEVADRAGVGVGTLYRHFANRDDLVHAVLTQLFEDVLSRVRAAAAIEDPGAALQQIPFTLAIDQPLFAVMHDPRCAKLMLDMKQQISQSMIGEIMDLIAGIVVRGIQAGTFRPHLDPPTTAIAILGSIGSVFENLAATRPLGELAALLADLHNSMVSAR
jgi:AcrR family transcriptional regulator